MVTSLKYIFLLSDFVYIILINSPSDGLIGKVKKLISEMDAEDTTLSCYFVFRRSYSTSSTENKTTKRKGSASFDGAGPSKVLKVEPPDSDYDSSSKINAFPGFEVDMDGYVHVYTDGACENNGRVGARAGIGVWFADNHPL